jgi:hypothetical protein
VPYKALDSLIDALSRYLRHLPLSEAEALMPRDPWSLQHVFPVLEQAGAVAQAPRRGLAADEQELRRRAFSALRELLGRLGDRKPLVLFLDDLQWGDADSAGLLLDLLRPPDPPVLFLLAAYRAEQADTSPFLQAFLPAREQALAGLDRREVPVQRLTQAEARELVLALLSQRGPAPEHAVADPAAQARAEAIARESMGYPFFTYELVEHLQAVRISLAEESSSVRLLKLENALWRRIQALPEGARHLLEVVAVAGRPLRRQEAFEAAGLGADDRAAYAALHAGRLIRGTSAAGEDGIEAYHDRIREVVVARLTPEELARHHRRLAIALEAAGSTDTEVLAVHLQGAGEPARASHYYALAAARAAEALAFDRAARLYHLALETGTPDGADRGMLRTRLGDALANAGRGAEAARAYLEAAQTADTAAALELRRRATQHYLMSGHHAEGLSATRSVLQAVGLQLAETPGRALLAYLGRRIQLRLRGLGFRERSAEEVPPVDLARIDVCRAVSAGLSHFDPVRSMLLHTRGLLYALRAGEPYRLAFALAVEATSSAYAGASDRRVNRLLRAAADLARRIPDPYLEAHLWQQQGIVAFLQGSWRSARDLCDRAEEVFRERCTGVAGELSTGQFFGLTSRLWLGELAELARRWPAALQEAQERGDLSTELNLNTVIMCLVRLAADDPDGARRAIERAAATLAQRDFHGPHTVQVWMARVWIHLYQGDVATAWNEILERWPAQIGPFGTRVQMARINWAYLRAAGALALAASLARPGPLIRTAAHLTRQMERERRAWSFALAQVLRAGLAATRRQRSDSVRLLARAATLLDAADMRLYATAVRRRQGELVGGAQGRDLVREADARMAQQQIRDPTRLTAMLVPGFQA